MKNIIVAFGGKSVEHDISVITGVLTVNSVDLKYNVIPVYFDKKGKCYTGESLKDISFYKNFNEKKVKRVTFLQGENKLFVINKNKIKEMCDISCVINCIHGICGEDGALAGLLKMSNIPLCSPDLFASSFSMDKDFTKTVLTGLGVKKLPYLRFFKTEFYKDKLKTVETVEKKFGYPVIIKPSKLGSSIGINCATNQKELYNALETGFSFDDKIIIEQKLEDFTEINCGAYKYNGNIVISNLEEPITKNNFLSFSDKYQCEKTGAIRREPINLPEKVAQNIKNTTKKIYDKADFTGVIRIDYIVKNNEVYLNEINTTPGSLAYYLFTDSIKGFTKMISELIEEGIKKGIKENSLNYEYKSSVLSELQSKGGKLKKFDN